MTQATERPFTLDHIDHVVLHVRDVDKSRAFYAMLGGEIGSDRPAGTPVRVTDGQTIILHSCPEYTPGDVTALNHINLNIRAENIQQVASYLKANGATFTREAPEDGGDTVRVLDPDQNVIEIRLIREKQSWRP
jgi:catechol 2,3-dioxygenase-like lactoylglutathione lyase family enzyme